MSSTTFFDNVKIKSVSGIGTPLLLFIMIVMTILPLPAFLLDVFFTFNLAFALIVLLASIYSSRPLDFSIFPTILLVATLLRLALNVASTRVVLLNGHTGTDAAGQVVASFGEVVIGGNYAVGFVVFMILVIINFVVVTKGAGRISEVTARFTLDAMPGKQMAIDADLNAGIINADEAKARREEVAKESDFYGSMDGASKFVRGDAIAGILILVINLIGGIAMGILQHNMSMDGATKIYALLTIGDGLVAQIPSLFLSTAAAMMVTRVSSSQDMGVQFSTAIFTKLRILYITSAVITLLGIIPGMPHLSFLTLALVTLGIALFIRHKQKNSSVVEEPVEEVAKPEEEETRELSWDDVASVDNIGLEIGYRLIPMVDKKQGGLLMQKIKGVRKKLSQELGFLVPAIHIRDNLDLNPNAYRVLISGVCYAEVEVYVDKYLAINPGQVYGQVDGIKTKDPSFGLDAVWVDEDKRDYAQSLGYTVVDCNTVIATHISQLLQNNASNLLGHEEVQKLVDKLTESSPKLVEELIPNILPLSSIVKILQLLLEEGVPIRDIRTVMETLAECARKCQDTDFLVAMVRVKLGKLIVQNINGLQNEISVMSLDPELEQILLQSVQVSDENSVNIEPGLIAKLQASLTNSAEKLEVAGTTPILCVPAQLRKLLAQFIKPRVPSINVLSYQEIPDEMQVKIIETIR